MILIRSKIPKASFSSLKLDFGDFYFFHEQSRKSINRLTEVETTSFGKKINHYREIELALKASRKREIDWWGYPHMVNLLFSSRFFTGLVS